MPYLSQYIAIAAASIATLAASAPAQAQEPAVVQTSETAPSPDDETDDESDGWELRPPEVDGYIQVHYKHSIETGSDGFNDNPNFRVQRARIGIEGELQPWLSYDLEIDPRAPEVTGIMRDAFIAFHVIPDHELRLGQQKTQFGWENPRSSTRHFFVNRSEMADNLARGTNLRDVGLGLLGHITINDLWRFEDAITVTNGQGFDIQEDFTARKNIWGRVGVRYRNGDFTLRFGLSGGWGDIFEEADPEAGEEEHVIDIWRFGTDLQLDHEWFFFAGEMAMGQDDVPALTSPEVTEAEVEDLIGYSFQLALKTPVNVGPLFRYDVESDIFTRYTFGAYYGARRANFRVLVNYELRANVDEVRADDKFYVWTQVRF